MQLFGHDLDHHVLVVAELGVNHEGDEQKAAGLIELAAAAGADAVKLQSYTPHRLTSTSDVERFDRVRRFALSLNAHHRLAELAAELHIGFFSTPASEDWVRLLEPISPVLKVASADLDFEPVIRACAATAKPIVLSTGMSTPERIERALAWIGEEREEPVADSVALLHCVSSYPTPEDQLNLLSIPYLRDRFGLAVGYSHHGINPVPCLAAVALGSRVLEVHFTDDRSGKTFRDHHLSLEPHELRQLVENVRLINRSLGSYEKTVLPCEKETARTSGKGLVAAGDLRAGTVLHRKNVMFARPSILFRADELERVIGRELVRDLSYGALIGPDDLKEFE